MNGIRLENSLSIPASGITFASGLSLLGTAVAGPVGGVTGALVGALGGIFAEVASQKKHERPKSQNAEANVGEVVIHVTEKQIRVLEVTPKQLHRELDIIERAGE
jgi:hypothetical protein